MPALGAANALGLDIAADRTDLDMPGFFCNEGIALFHNSHGVDSFYLIIAPNPFRLRRGRLRS